MQEKSSLEGTDIKARFAISKQLYGNDRPARWHEKEGYSKGQLLEPEVGKLSRFSPAVYQFQTLQWQSVR